MQTHHSRNFVKNVIVIVPLSVFFIFEACSLSPKYKSIERWVPEGWTQVHWVYRQDDLDDMAELYHFVTPDNSLVRAELEKIDWKDYGYDEELNIGFNCNRI